MQCGEGRDKLLWEYVIVFYRLTASVKTNSQINEKMMDNTLRNVCRLEQALKGKGVLSKQLIVSGIVIK